MITIRFICLVALLALLACDPNNTPSPRGSSQILQKGHPAWLHPAMVDSVRWAMEQGERTGDVPVGACVGIATDTGWIITTGHNTTLSNGEAAGHAEINAITNAIAAVGGAKKFSALDRERIVLLTSFEPCPMCAGAIALWKMEISRAVALAQEAGATPKLPEWRTPELEAVQQLREGWIFTGDDTLQLDFFCRRPGFRQAYPHACR